MENTGEYFSLKWSNFRSSLTEGFHDFLQEEAMVDVTLAVEGKFVQAHKLVLSVCSPYFKNLFKVNPCKHPIVILKDVCHNDLSYLLEFMYKGEVGVKHEDLASFLKLADSLKIKGLAGEKVQDETSSTKNLEINMARVRKKINKNSTSDLNKENTEIHLSQKTDESSKKILRSKKRRLSCKSESVKKFKSEKCDDSVTKCKNKNNNGNLSEEEDNNPLIKFIESDEVKNSEGLRQSESQCDNEKDSQCENKSSFSVWSDGVPDSDDSGEQNMNSYFQQGYSEETEQTPQGPISSLIVSRAPRAFVWDYFLKETHQAICLNCGKTFKGQRPNTICEQHLKRRHPEFYKVLLEKKIKRAELHMNPTVMGLGLPSFDHG